jgi:hypothetical protein
VGGWANLGPAPLESTQVTIQEEEKGERVVVGGGGCFSLLPGSPMQAAGFLFVMSFFLDKSKADF